MKSDQNIGLISMRIWQACSHAKGIMPDEQLQEIAIALTFLRRIDCLIGDFAEESSSFYINNKERLSDERLDKKLKEISGGYPFYNYSGYTFNRILYAKSSLEVVLNSYLKGFSYNVWEFLEGMYFTQNLAVLQRQSRYLVGFFELFSELDLSLTAIDNEEFIELITYILSDGKRVYGENFTYLGLSKLISECLLNEDIRDSKEEALSIYDPVCGTGSMLAIAGEKAKGFAVHQDKVSLYGQEVSILPSAIAKALVLLTGNESSSVQYGNTLIEDMFSNNKFHYIMADTPLGISWRPFKERIKAESLSEDGRFFIGLPAVNDGQLLFLEHIISKMDPSGSRAAFISNATALWGGNAQSGESRIRRWLFENDMVETIIALPSGSRISSSLPLYLWIFTNKKSSAQKGKVRLIDTTSIATNYRRNVIDSEFVKSVVEEYKSKVLSTMSQIIKNEQFGFYEVALLENGKKAERVTISLDTDIHEFVEKERQPFTDKKVTIDYSSVEKGYSVQFDKFFKKEQNDIMSLNQATEELFPVIEAVTSLKYDIAKIVENTDSISWVEYPLRAATDLFFGVNVPSVESDEGLPILNVQYLRKPSGSEARYEVTSKTKCSTVNDVIIIVRGENSGEVFRGVDGILSPSLAILKCKDDKIIAPQYFYYLLKGYERELRTLARGVAVKSLDSKTMSGLKIMIPPVEEQLRLATFLDDIIGKLDNVIKVLGSTGNVFSAYRQTLIENVVRGKLLLE